jgi:hypothetical protein
MSDAVQLSPLRSRGRRCPWYRDALDLAARPRAPYDRWTGTAMVFAGSQAWQLAEHARTAGQRAVTLLPPGAEPEAMRWPPVLCWIGDCGDLDAGRVVRLAQVLVGAGALRLHLLAKNIEGGLVNVKVTS